MIKPLALLLSILPSLIAVFAQATYAACINSMATTTPSHYFEIRDDTVYDQSTGLLWQRCAVGQKWDKQTQQCHLNSNTPFTFTWLEAQQTSAKAGQPGWRIPSKIELLSLVERACTGPSINEQIFPDTPYQGFWSVSTTRAQPDHQWVVNFKTGSLEAIKSDQVLSVRLVKTETK